VVGNDGLIVLRWIWTISHGHLDHSRDCHRRRYRVAPTIRFLVMGWRPLITDARPFFFSPPRSGGCVPGA
jgi:hypothetical protein